MSDILLTHGYFLADDEHERRIMKPYPPLGILYISSYLKSKGIGAEVFDTTFKSRDEFAAMIRSKQPEIVGIYCNLMTKLSVLDLISLCKKEGAVVILGGPEPAASAEEFLRRGSDVIVIGEGEQTTADVVAAIQRRGAHRLHDIPGIAFKDERESIVRTQPREFLQDLDSIPFPDRESISIGQYLETWRRYHSYGSVSLITARGCPYTCTWCSHGVYGFTHRRRKPAGVVDEIELLSERYRPDMFWIADDVFTINHRWIREFSDEMHRRNLKIRFECISRADRLDENILEILSNLGCARIWYGSESGSQRVLDAMSRGVTPRQIQHVARLAGRVGIETGLFVMVGYEGETTTDIEATISHLKKTNADHVLTTVAYPIKGTAYYEQVKSKISSELPWEQRTDRQLHVGSRYTDRYYWFAQRRIANEVLREKLSAAGRRNSLQWLKASAKSAVARVGMELLGFARTK